jgi:hypothetical protein
MFSECVFHVYIAFLFEHCFSLRLEVFDANGKTLHFGYYMLFQVLYQQFKFFLNLYFLVMATSQFIPDIRIGYLYTYWGPLVIYIFTNIDLILYVTITVTVLGT